MASSERRPEATPVLGPRNAVAVVFVLNGFCFASWVSRIPDTRDLLSLGNGELGLLLLSLSVGSLLALPLTAVLIERLGAARVVVVGAVIGGSGLALISVGVGWAAIRDPGPVAAGLFLYGVGTGVWDVAMNVEGAAVERQLARTVMPRFHAAFSLGSVLGAVLGVGASGGAVPMTWHLGAVAVLAVAVVAAATRHFLPRAAEEASPTTARRRSAFAAWTEPRTVLLGLMVLALALAEGTANDWLAVALVDGYGVAHWVGVSGFALFVVAMTAGRWWGSALLDRYGRAPVLWTTMAVAAGGLVLIVFGAHLPGGPLPPVALGILLWGLGASLGFPVGMSAAGDDPEWAAARVSVVSTIGYTAFLAGPPLLGFLAEQVGALHALLVVAILLVPAAAVVPAAREADARPAGQS